MSYGRVSATSISENSLFAHISKIIEKRKNRAGMYANREVTLMYWEIGRYISSVLLGGERAEYGKKIVVTLSQQLVKRYGSSYELRNLRRMVQFAELFPDLSIVSPLATQLQTTSPLSRARKKFLNVFNFAFQSLFQSTIQKHLSRF